ncbi:Ferric reduction oxidase [Melia azedarach]|uniref:Ferric reduction oxidase n=1 Tax=Melia azedarach TaxID=155640 RepID=A0ACC1X3M7_MELAZ|nr:Ferric reduction oxidase [Melia azedarach]
MEYDKLSILVQSQGSWTQKLYRETSSSVDRIEVSVEGPYGPNSYHFLRHESLVMVSGGSGISPFISIIREIIFQSNKPDFQVPNVHLICSFKNFADLSMLDILLPIFGTPVELSKLQLQIEVYVTKENERPKSDTQNLLQSIWFKPNPLDSPISSALGSNSWLWLGAIITSSFIMFLLLLGIVTRFYIYPIERNGTEVYHYSYKCLWDMFLVCVCVFIVSSSVYLWSKQQQNAQREANSIVFLCEIFQNTNILY